MCVCVLVLCPSCKRCGLYQKRNIAGTSVSNWSKRSPNFLLKLLHHPHFIRDCFIVKLDAKQNKTYISENIYSKEFYICFVAHNVSWWGFGNRAGVILRNSWILLGFPFLRRTSVFTLMSSIYRGLEVVSLCNQYQNLSVP